MGNVANRTDLDALRADVARIENELSFDFAAPSPLADLVEPLPDELPPAVDQFDGVPCDRQPFGAWLLTQSDRDNWIADLAKWARSDPAFPKQGTADDVRKRLSEIRAEGDAFEALDDAEMDWLAL